MSLADYYQKALDKANAANERRYGQILGGYDDLRGRVMGDLANVGAQERMDIDREYRSMGSDVYQRLVNRGFANSTIPATMQMGVTREKMGAVGRLNDRLAQQRAHYDTSLTQGKLGVMERRTDEGPDMNQLLALAQGLGRAGYGGGGYGGGGYGAPLVNLMPYFQSAMAMRQNAMNFSMLPFMGGRYQRSPYLQGRSARAKQQWAMKNANRKSTAQKSPGPYAYGGFGV